MGFGGRLLVRIAVASGVVGLLLAGGRLTWRFLADPGPRSIDPPHRDVPLEELFDDRRTLVRRFEDGREAFERLRRWSAGIARPTVVFASGRAGFSASPGPADQGPVTDDAFVRLGIRVEVRSHVANAAAPDGAALELVDARFPLDGGRFGELGFACDDRPGRTVVESCPSGCTVYEPLDGGWSLFARIVKSGD